MKAFMVACCSCGVLLLKNGGRGPGILTDGNLDLRKLDAIRGNESLATFATTDECDAAAVAAGWRAEQRNHRCPACLYEEGQSRGMYIDCRTMEVAL